jgi:BlaI family transcriptional regulator, penicillinase repressor
VPPLTDEHLTRRERQIMDVLYSAGPSSAAGVLQALSDPPSYSAVRALLRILVDKGEVRYQKRGNRYIYRPAQSRRKAARSALSRVLNTFYEGSLSSAVAGLLEVSDRDLSADEWGRLAGLIDRARHERRP